MVELSEIPLASHPELYLPTLLFLTLVFFRHHIISYITPKPLPGIPHLDYQAPILGDAVALGEWRSKYGTVTPWFGHVATQLVGPGSKHQGEGICQVMFGRGAKDRQIIVSDAREAEDILVRRTAEFDRADVSIAVFSGIIPLAQIALPTNAMWKHHRRLLGPSMSSKSLAKYAPRAWKFAEELVELWKVKADLAKSVATEAEAANEKDGAGDGVKKVLPMFETRLDMSLAFSDAITDIAFGEAYGCTRSAIDQVKAMSKENVSIDKCGGVVFETKGPEVYVATQGLFGSLPYTSPAPSLQNFYNKNFNRSFRHNVSIVHGFLDRRIAAGRALAIERGDERAELADTALDLCCLKEGGPDSLSNEAMRSELFQFLVAGEETSATTMSWFVKYMARYPDVQRKLRKELLVAGFDQTAPTFTSIGADKAPYLEAVVHETLRSAMTAGAVNRTATVDTTVLGHFIPKGANILIPISTLQSRPLKEYAARSTYEEKRSESSQDHFSDKKGWAEWKDPAAFDPDRWLDQDGKFDRDAGTSWPFSLGQRGCFGKALAVLEIKLFVAALNLAFFFEPIPAEFDTESANEFVTRKPRESYVRLSAWAA